MLVLIRDMLVSKLYTGKWTGTMCLTEPQAGSAVGDLKTSAVPVENIPACLSGRPPRASLRVLNAYQVRAISPDYEGVIPGDTGGRGSILKSLSELSIGDPAKKRAIQEDLSKLGPIRPLRTDGTLDLFGHAKSYIRDGYYTKSLRCTSCVHNSECRGMHINHIRAHGYRVRYILLWSLHGQVSSNISWSRSFSLQTATHSRIRI